MPFEVKFAEAVDRALARKDVARALAGSRWKDAVGDLRSELLSDEVEVRGLLAPALLHYEETESEFAEIVSELVRLTRPRGAAAAFEPIVGWLILLGVGAGVARLFGSTFASDFIGAAFAAPLGDWRQLALTAAFLGLLVAAGARLRWALSDRKAALTTDVRLTAKDNEISVLGASIQTRLDELAAANASEAIGRAAQPFFQARLLLEQDAVDHERRLKITFARGLSEVADKNHVTPTVARRDILNLLNDLPGASIGLSGPRGAGKSTILRSLTGANLPLKGKGGKEAIAIYTAAPVEYDARDFLLHLFATLCRQVLRTHKVPEEDPEASLAASQDSPDQWLERMKRVAPLLLWAGIIFSGLAFAIAYVVQSLAGPVGAFVRTLELKVGPLLLLGLACFLLGVLIHFYSVSGERAAAGRSRSTIARIFFWVPHKPAPPAPPASPLVALTRRELQDIRFQRSFTEGWSGAIKIPVGFDLGRSGSASLSQRQESLPELVDRFCTYVGQVAAEHGAVVIAVDELDKIKTAAEAEEFINSVKSIFSIPNCFYLISVSEEALSAFERRGLSLRDAFDSAFDDIRYIGYQHLAGSREMLLRRTLNLPDPFLCLCHILSGGLPRDLIRIARAVIQTGSRLPVRPATLRAVALRVVSMEAEAKIRASRTAMRSVAIEPEAGNFAAALGELEDHPPWTAAHRKALKSLIAETRNDADPAAFAKLVAIQRELGAYLDFLGVTLKLADKLGTRAGWQAVADKEVERLARARQALESSVSVGVMQVARLRAEIGA